MKIDADIKCLFCGEQVFQTEKSEEVITCFKDSKGSNSEKVIAYLECIKGHSCPYEIDNPLKQ
jgi:hypothetical protein